MHKELTLDELLEVHGGRSLGDFLVGAGTGFIDTLGRTLGVFDPPPGPELNAGANGHGSDGDGGNPGGFDNPTGDPVSPDYGHSDGSPAIEPS